MNRVISGVLVVFALSGLGISQSVDSEPRALPTCSESAHHLWGRYGVQVPADISFKQTPIHIDYAYATALKGKYRLQINYGMMVAAWKTREKGGTSRNVLHEGASIGSDWSLESTTGKSRHLGLIFMTAGYDDVPVGTASRFDEVLDSICVWPKSASPSD